MGLTPLGIVHTAIGLIAVAVAIVALVRDKEISPRNLLGQVYIWTTIVTCLTGFGIFQHGGFNKAHALGVLTLLVLAVAAVAGRTRVFGNASRYVETVAYSMTFLFHWIPAITETSIRLPVGDPVFPNPDAPGLKVIAGVLFLLFLVGAALQVRWLKRSSPAPDDLGPASIGATRI